MGESQESSQSLGLIESWLRVEADLPRQIVCPAVGSLIFHSIPQCLPKWQFRVWDDLLGEKSTVREWALES